MRDGVVVAGIAIVEEGRRHRAILQAARPSRAMVDAHDPYALSKWLGEEIVEAAVRRGAFPAVSLRMPWIQTPRTFFVEVSRRRQTAEAARDLSSYLDARAAAAFVAAVERSTEGQPRLFLARIDGGRGSAKSSDKG